MQIMKLVLLILQNMNYTESYTDEITARISSAMQSWYVIIAIKISIYCYNTVSHCNFHSIIPIVAQIGVQISDMA